MTVRAAFDLSYLVWPTRARIPFQRPALMPGTDFSTEVVAVLCDDGQGTATDAVAAIDPGALRANFRFHGRSPDRLSAATDGLNATVGASIVHKCDRHPSILFTSMTARIDPPVGDDRFHRLRPARSTVFDTYPTPAAETVVDRPLPNHLTSGRKAVSDTTT